MIKKYSLRKCAKDCGISLSNAFIWCHKILDAPQNMRDEFTLDGVVEVYETFTNVFYKGLHKSFTLPVQHSSTVEAGLVKRKGLYSVWY